VRPEPLDRVEEVFHAALACAGEERASLIERECAGDVRLRAEVESLISYYEKPGEFIERPAFEDGLGLIDSARPRLRAGQSLGNYRIIRLLGAGGMGEVYEAEDTRLGRRVALKLLSASFVEEEGRLRQLKREASTASALNHPGILTIHEIDRAEGIDFISTELVEGATLRERITRGSLELTELLDISVQIASALAAAHAAGIIHRDIKPENVMIRPDGYVKLLDFGLACPTPGAQLPSPADPDAPPRGAQPVTLTNSCVLMGTVAYMSPEQARGLEVDARSDVWSLGVVLHEMAAGRRPFEGETVADALASITGNEPEPLSLSAPGSPEELGRAVTKALRKEPRERYQSAAELADDLRRIRRRLEAETGDRPGPVLGAPARLAGRPTRLSKVWFAAALAAAVLVAVTVGLLLRSGRGAGAAEIKSVAVLPFVNASGDPETEYLSDGLTESVISDLSRLPRLRIMSRNSVFRYKGDEVNALGAGRALGVQAVLTGRVETRGGRLVVSVELIDVPGNRQLWGEQFARRDEDLLALQKDISREISERLRLRLSGDDERRVARRYTEDVEAYQHYLRGRYFWNKRTPEGIRKGIEYFERARGRDPSYALAHAGLADSYHLLALYFVLPPQEAYPKAKEAALTAVKLDDMLAEAHASLAYVTQNYEWDWSGAEGEFRRAIELNPNYATAHQWFAWHLMLRGRSEEAYAEMRRALELDPLSVAINADLGLYFYYTRQHERAEEQFLKTLEMDPGFKDLHLYLFQNYMERGMFEEAFAEAERAGVRSWGGREDGLPLLKRATLEGGVRGYWQKILELELERVRRDGGRPEPATMSQCYANIGDKDQAFVWLARAYGAHSDAMLYLKVNPIYDGLRADPRFDELLRRVNLAP
jgi:serine/threonine-protein kinase